jgi:hypothetical protein
MAKTTQQEIILGHLLLKGGSNAITSVEAIGLYGITRLAAVVGRLKEQKYNIVTEMKAGVHSTYASYSLKKNKKN